MSRTRTSATRVGTAIATRDAACWFSSGSHGSVAGSSDFATSSSTTS
jgi:hypothetical protein